jgi:quinoprotein glucose dehydrogenase
MRMAMGWARWIGAAAVAMTLTACGPANIYGAADKAAIAPSADSGQWPAINHDGGGSQSSPLTQITRDNVSKLQLAWTHNSGDFVIGGVGKGTSLDVTPIFVNGALYYCTPLDRVFALDPVTGKARWVYDPFGKQPDGAPALTGTKGKNSKCKGVAFWQDTAAAPQGQPQTQAAAAPAALPCRKRIFRADGGGRLFAIDADTGYACRGFGPTAHPGYVDNYEYENFAKDKVSELAALSAPPVVIGDEVVVALASRDGIQDSSDGLIRAFDARTGAVRWTFDPIPEQYRHNTGAANVWSGMTVDPKNNLIFLPTTSPSVDYWGGARLFDMPLTSAIVALNAATGQPVWSFQTTHHDLWDYDLPSHPLLVTIKKDGQPRDVVIQQTKTGHLFVLDRLTGKPVFPIDEVSVPASPLPDDKAAPTQPIPRIDTFAHTTLDHKAMFGIFGFDKAWCQSKFDHARWTGIYTPPGTEDYIEFPSTLGGGNWGGAAYDPRTNSLIIKASNIATRLKLVHKDPSEKPVTDSDFMSRTLEGPYRITGGWFLSPIGIPCNPPPYGTLTSVSMDTGKTNWRVALGQSYRYGILAPKFLNWGSPSVGGPMVTGGGVVFIGATLDSRFRAIDASTGRELWRAKLPVPASAVPMTYMAGGRQYVVIASGGDAISGMKQGDSIMAYALPKTGS